MSMNRRDLEVNSPIALEMCTHPSARPSRGGERYNPCHDPMRERTWFPVLQRFAVILLLVTLNAVAQSGRDAARSRAHTGGLPPVGSSLAKSQICGACIHANMDFLASDALRGRGSATPDEFIAATYVGAQLEQYGVEPAGDNGTYVQQGTLLRVKLTAAPQLKYMTPGNGIPAETKVWTHGKEMLVLYLKSTDFRGPLKRVDADSFSASAQTDRLHNSGPQAAAATNNIQPGSVTLILGRDREKIQAAVSAAIEGGAAAVLMPASPQVTESWESRGKTWPELPLRVEGMNSGPELGGANVFALSQEALASLKGIPDGSMFYFEGAISAPEKVHTWNAVGKITGSDPALRQHALLLSAHLDHLGVGKPVKGDSIYNGADDDASGTVAVLELARVLALGPKPKRTVVFALFGSEEFGGLGSTWFELHPPISMEAIAVNLGFEMIGRPDPKYPVDYLWLTGWERSNLGPALAEHGAKLVADARPDQDFFARSDNYVFAKKGIVAQTVSSYGMHADYHKPSDDVAHIDFKHMTAAIASLIAPVEWLVNSNFEPQWKPGGRP